MQNHVRHVLEIVFVRFLGVRVKRIRCGCSKVRLPYTVFCNCDKAGNCCNLLTNGPRNKMNRRVIRSHRRICTWKNEA